MTSQRLVKTLLRLFIFSIVGTALAALYVLAVPGEDWEYKIKILLSTATIAGASISGLACGGCLSLGQRNAPFAGLCLTCLAAILVLIGIWTVPQSITVSEKTFWEQFWKITISVAIYAIAFAHLSLLLMARLAGAYRWAYVVAYYLILGFATVIVAGIFLEYFNKDEYVKMAAAISIMVAAISLMIPVFHVFSRDLLKAHAAETDPLIAVEEELARVKKRMIELASQRRMLLARSEPGENLKQSK